MRNQLLVATSTLMCAGTSIVSIAAGTVGPTVHPGEAAIPDFGPNVVIFNPTDPIEKVNGTLQAIEKKSTGWDRNRTAVYFMPGTYGESAAPDGQATAKNFVSSVVGVMMSVQGLGESPDEVTINGNLRILGNLSTFWRSLQNFRVNPVDPEAPNTLRFIVSEASPIRRLDVAGDLDLGVGHIAFGAAIGNTKVAGVVRSGNARGTDIRSAAAQAHYYTQNSEIAGWTGQSLNFVFTGVKGAPPTDFDPGDKTTLLTTPISRDAPFLFLQRNRFNVFVPKAQINARGTDWSLGEEEGQIQPIDHFFIAKPSNGASAINAALERGQNVLLTPGVYELDQAIHITRPNTVVLGMGYATLMPTHGTAAIETDDVPGVIVSSLIVDAGEKNSDVLVRVGPPGASHGSETNPSTLVDVFIRCGGALAGKATTSIELNQNYSLINHTWIWRADLGPSGLGPTINPGDYGLVVNGDHVTVLGAYVEHYRKQQVLWNGDAGQTIFFQSEPPPDAMTQADRMNGSEKGYAYYEVAPNVKSHEGIGFVMYGSAGRSAEPIMQTSEIKAPETPNVTFRSITSVWLYGHGGYENTVNHDGKAVGKGVYPSFIPGLASTRQLAKWPNEK